MDPDALVLAAGTVQATPFLDRLGPARDAGFAGVSMFAADFEAMAEAGITPVEIRDAVSGAGLFVSEVEIVGNWLAGAGSKPLPGWLGALLDRMTPARVIGIAKAVGARGITVGEMRGIRCDPDRSAEAFAAICALAARHDLNVALEFIPTGGIATLADGWDIVRRAGCANGGLLVDAWHFFRSGSSLDQLATLPGRAIASIQLCDAPAAPEADLDAAMVRSRLLPGEGALDLAGLMDALERTGTIAPVAVEVFSDDLAARPVAEVAMRSAQAARALLGEMR